MSSLTRLVEHSPLHWSSVLLRVCVQCSGPAQHIAGCQNSCPVPLPFPSPSPSPQQWLLAVLKEVTSTKRNPPGSIDSSVKFWVANSVTQPLCALLRTCVDVLSVAASVVLQPLVIPSPPPRRVALDASSLPTHSLEQLLGQTAQSEWIFAYLMCVPS